MACPEMVGHIVGSIADAPFLAFSAAAGTAGGTLRVALRSVAVLLEILKMLGIVDRQDQPKCPVAPLESRMVASQQHLGVADEPVVDVEH